MAERAAKLVRSNDGARNRHQAVLSASNTAPYFFAGSLDNVSVHRKASCACGGGEYRPAHENGRHLLAHELAHI